MRRLFGLIVVAFLVLPAPAQNKHPFTFEDMMALKRAGEPIVSPDGKWVLFSAVDVSLEANTKTPHIWVVPTAGGEAREIIHVQESDRPRWAPDGKRFLFLSSKEGGSQIWIADFDGAKGQVTATHQLTSIATEADGPIWSPDGKNILFVSNVYPECPDEACNAKKVEDAEKSKVKALIFTHLLYRHWNAYKAGKRDHLLIISADGGASRDLTPGDHDVPPFSLGGQDDYAFSPDGQEICYTSNHDEDEALSTNNDLFIVSVNGGTAKKITDNPASDSSPLYSPDGKYIAYRAQVRAGYESDRFRLMLYNRRSGHIRNLTESFDRWVGTYAWDPDSSKIYFVAEDKGDSPVYSIALDTAVIGGDEGKDTTAHLAKNDVKLIVPGHNDDVAVTQDGKSLLFTRMSVRFPNEIFRATLAQPGSSSGGASVFESQEVCTDASGKIKPEGCKAATVGKSEVQLTDLNHAVLARVAMSPLESFWFTGASNDKVEAFFVRPPNFDAKKKYPVKFLIHGGPQGAWGDDWSYRWNPELFAANGYVVIMINFHGSTGYGQKFIDAVNGDWGGAPFDDLMKGLDDAERDYPFIDKNRECALGASFGGYMANWILGHSQRFKCIVSHDGTFNNESDWGTTEELWFEEWELKGPLYNNRELYRKWSPHLSALNFKTPTLVIHGQLDYRLDVSEGFQLFTTLQRLKVPSKMLYFPDEGHWVLKPQNSQLWYKTVNDWVDQWAQK
jgi:dipeptidyl aminopeptidase/acylaminoacyl peptidase